MVCRLETMKKARLPKFWIYFAKIETRCSEQVSERVRPSLKEKSNPSFTWPSAAARIREIYRTVIAKTAMRRITLQTNVLRENHTTKQLEAGWRQKRSQPGLLRRKDSKAMNEWAHWTS